MLLCDVRRGGLQRELFDVQTVTACLWPSFMQLPNGDARCLIGSSATYSQAAF